MRCSEVEIEDGRVAGYGDDIRLFKGIPYAAPPVGANRWRAPQPVESWRDVRDCAHFGPACLQVPPPSDAILSVATFGGESGFSEDCLYLNVWTPAQSDAERLPVMVWIHGGGFRAGWGHQPVYDGEGLARKGVVIVTFNYRLGVFGFFSHPDFIAETGLGGTANYGIMDMIAALKWVQQNIGKFGGDPHNVTIFGESGGARAVHLLTVTRHAEGLFHKAIGESGGNFAGASGAMQTLAVLQARGQELADTVGCRSLSDLRALPATVLLAAYSGPPMPVIDGWMFSQTPDEAYALGRQNDVPTLVGSNANEGTPYAKARDLASYIENARKLYGDAAAEFLEIYPARSDEEVLPADAEAVRDSVFGWQAWAWARAQASTGANPPYLYWFNQAPPLPDQPYRERFRAHEFGAFHSSEIIYAMNNLSTRSWNWSDIDHRIADMMSSYWTNFARHGDPNGPALPNWPAFDPNENTVMHLGSRIEAGPLMHHRGLAFFERHFRR